CARRAASLGCPASVLLWSDHRVSGVVRPRKPACPRSAQNAAGLLEVAVPAQRFVGDRDAVDGDLIAVEDETAADFAPVEDRLASASADGLQFLEGVRDRQLTGGAGVGVGAEFVEYA